MYSRIENDTEKTDFIYDCGSKEPKIINYFLKCLKKHTCLKSLIYPYLNDQKATVDRLYISHFDTDHINGIKDLCTQIDFKKVFFPLYPEGYRLLLALNYIYNNKTADTNIAKAIYDPENYLRTITGDGEILPIPPIKEAPDLSKIIPQTEKSDPKT
jgi:mRNA degradation ribonuclease J1/J2